MASHRCKKARVCYHPPPPPYPSLILSTTWSVFQVSHNFSTPFRQAHGAAWQVRLEQVVAMDVNFALLTRVWCVAELVEADHLHIHQVSLKSRKCCQMLMLPVSSETRSRGERDQ